MSRTRMLRAVGGLVTVCIFAGGFIAAQEKQAPRRFGSTGVIELGGSAMFNYSTPVVDGKTGNAVWAITATPAVGYFVIDDLSVGAEPLGVSVYHSTGGTLTSLRMLGSVAYHHRINRLLYLYAQGLAGYTADIASSGGATATRSGFSFGGRLGGKFPVADRGLINVGVHYLLIAVNPAGVSKRYGYNELAVTVGFAIWL